MLATAVIVTGAVIFAGALARVYYRGTAWHVGSLDWSLRELQVALAATDFQIVVKKDDPEDVNNEQRVARTRSPRVSADRESLAATIKSTLSFGRPANSEPLCSYHLRRVSSTVRAAHNTSGEFSSNGSEENRTHAA